jgi:hypothetical protein
MKTYTTIQNSIASKLSSIDTYRFTCLSFTPRKNGYTDTTFKQLADICKEPVTTIKHFTERLKFSEIIRIDEVYVAGQKRNNYYIPVCKTNFRMISNAIIDAEFANEFKGFLIQLFTLTINNTYQINFSMNKICSLIKISKPTASKYLKELENLQLVTRTEKGFILSDKYFSVGNIKQKQIKAIEAKISGSVELSYRFDNTDWKSIINPLEYWRSVEGGYTNFKQSRI